MPDPRFLARAVELAASNAQDRQGGPFGAVIVRDGEIIAEGRNLVTSTLDPTAHAEIVAIRDAARKLKDFRLLGCDMYTSCEPCPMCLGAIYWARMDRIYFAASREDAAAAGFDDQYLYEEFALALEHRRLPIARLEVAFPLSPFEAWNRDYGKIRY